MASTTLEPLFPVYPAEVGPIPSQPPAPVPPAGIFQKKQMMLPVVATDYQPPSAADLNHIPLPSTKLEPKDNTEIERWAEKEVSQSLHRNDPVEGQKLKKKLIAQFSTALTRVLSSVNGHNRLNTWCYFWPVDRSTMTLMLGAVGAHRGFAEKVNADKAKNYANRSAKAVIEQMLEAKKKQPHAVLPQLVSNFHKVYQACPEIVIDTLAREISIITNLFLGKRDAVQAEYRRKAKLLPDGVSEIQDASQAWDVLNQAHQSSGNGKPVTKKPAKSAKKPPKAKVEAKKAKQDAPAKKQVPKKPEAKKPEAKKPEAKKPAAKKASAKAPATTKKHQVEDEDESDCAQTEASEVASQQSEESDESEETIPYLNLRRS